MNQKFEIVTKWLSLSKKYTPFEEGLNWNLSKLLVHRAEMKRHGGGPPRDFRSLSDFQKFV